MTTVPGASAFCTIFVVISLCFQCEVSLCIVHGVLCVSVWLACDDVYACLVQCVMYVTSAWC